MSQSSARDRAIGALVGLAVGDAVGTTLEFKPPGSFKPIDDMVGGGPFNLQPGQWTDDTTMAMCLGESIIDKETFDPHDQLRRYQLWYDQGYWSVLGRCFDIGHTKASAIQRFATDGSITNAVIDQESAANGSLMRLAPVPIRWHFNIERASELSAASSATTHEADRPVDACRVFGAMIAALIQGQSFQDVVHPDFWSFGPLDPHVENVIRGSWTQKEPPEIRGTGYVIDALEAAIWSVAGADTFRDAVLRAANLGNDADTTAAIAGQLAGARFGASAIPKSWIDQLAHRERIFAIAGTLYQHGLNDAHGASSKQVDGLQTPGSSTGDPWEFDEFVHAYWVEPGVLIAGEYPGDLDSEKAVEKVNLLIDAGMRTFINLTKADELMPYDRIVDDARRARQVDVQVIHHPIPDFGVIEQQGYTKILESIRTRSHVGAVYVHCWGGIGRTGTVVGCHLVDSGMTGEEAIDRIAKARSQSRKHRVLSPENNLQRDIIYNRKLHNHM